jgi:hypothetical protein
MHKGGIVFLPSGSEHGYTIHSDEPVRLLVLTAPVRDGAGGWGGFTADLESGQGELLRSPENPD